MDSSYVGPLPRLMQLAVLLVACSAQAAAPEDGEFFEIRIPRHAGIAGAVAASGEILNIPDAYADPRFDPSTDRVAEYLTHTLLCVPLRNRQGRVFGVAEMINRLDGSPFDAHDEERFREFMGSVGIILESWWQMSEGNSGSR